MDIKNTLEQFGLQGKKAEVYLAALELGGASVIDIAKKAGVKRTTTYDILIDLERDGIISQTSKGKRRLFIGEDPEKIKKDLRKKERLFDELLPQLKSIYNISGTKPKIRFYEGKTGLIEVYDDTLKYSGELLAFASEDVVKVLGMGWAIPYVKQRVKRGIFYRGILAKSTLLDKEFLSKDQEQLRTSKVIDSKKYPFSIEIMIYGFQKVSLVSAKEQIGVIIEGAEIFRTMKSIFELLWDNLPEVKK